MAIKAEWSWPLVSSVMKDIITQSRSNANRKLNAQLKNEGHSIKSGRRRLDVIPLVDSRKEAVIPVAPAPSQFQKSIQNNRQKLHPLWQEPLTSSNSSFPFLSEKSAPFHSSSPRTLQGSSNHQSPEKICKPRVESCVQDPQNTKHTASHNQSSKSQPMLANRPPIKGIISIWHNKIFSTNEQLSNQIYKSFLSLTSLKMSSLGYLTFSPQIVTLGTSLICLRVPHMINFE